MNRIIAFSLAFSAFVWVGCSEDNDETSQQKVNVPQTYEFKRNGKTTVNFSGQTTRILMTTELTEALKNPEKTQEQLQQMFAHQQNNNDFSLQELNASSKSVKSKTAASADFFSTNTTTSNLIKNQLDFWIKEQVTEVLANRAVNADVGIAGKLQESGGGATRYFNKKGVEINQVFSRALIGGLMVDQILNNYLSSSVLDSGNNIKNNNDNILEEGQNYTTMEHKWDEAYGYLYGLEKNPSLPELQADNFLNKYVYKVSNDVDFKDIAKEIFDAFKKGRAAIVAKNYQVRDEQANILRTKISSIIAIRAVYYLQQGKVKWENDKAAAFHDLSEGLGFIYSLQFTRKPNTNESYFTNAEVKEYLKLLLEKENGLWDASSLTVLDQISKSIANKFDFTINQAGS